MFIFQKPNCGVSAWAATRAATAMATITPRTPATTDDYLNADRMSPGVYPSADLSHENSALDGCRYALLERLLVAVFARPPVHDPCFHALNRPASDRRALNGPIDRHAHNLRDVKKRKEAL